MSDNRNMSRRETEGDRNTLNMLEGDRNTLMEGNRKGPPSTQPNPRPYVMVREMSW